ncbi:MAG TPA: AraC family transcriptional regulator [Clostridiales bacterium]|nr:AraC family transcriptional regulator [Clostridiales bacterium]
MLEIDVTKDSSQKMEYNVTGLPIFISQIMLEIDHDLAVECHWHDDVEFFLVTEGELKYNINGKCIELKKGEGLFINSRQMHYGFSIGENKCDCICVVVHPMLLCSSEYMEEKFINPVMNNNNFTYAFLSKDKQWTAEIFENIHSIYKEHMQGKESNALKIQSIIYATWELLYDNMPSQSDAPQPCNYELCSLKEMLDFIHKNYAEKLTLADIAKAGKVCKSRCCEIFKQYLNQTTRNYITTYRLRKSTELLANTDMSVAEIAVSVGFIGASYYAEIFRKHYTCSPSEYRNKN